MDIGASTYEELKKEFSGIKSELPTLPCRGNFESCVVSVKEHQNLLKWNPSDPLTEMGKAIFDAVKDELKKREGLKFKKLRLFLCFNSILEKKYGVKFLVECDTHKVYLGFSMKKAEVMKSKESRAHLVLSKEEFVKDELSKVAEKIVSILYPESWKWRKAPPYKAVA